MKRQKKPKKILTTSTLGFAQVSVDSENIFKPLAGIIFK